MENIEHFNEITATVFATLYERFPEQALLSYAKLAGIDEAEIEARLPLDVPKAFRFAEASVDWLKDAGFIWVSDRNQFAVRARLSHQGLQTLNLVPSSIESSVPIGDSLLGAVRSGAGDLARELVKEALIGGFRFFTA